MPSDQIHWQLFCSPFETSLRFKLSRRSESRPSGQIIALGLCGTGLWLGGGGGGCQKKALASICSDFAKQSSTLFDGCSEAKRQLNLVGFCLGIFNNALFWKSCPELLRGSHRKRGSDVGSEWLSEPSTSESVGVPPLRDTMT